MDTRVTDWLMQGDPSIRFQTMRDLLDSNHREAGSEQEKVTVEGWGARLLSLQDAEGTWNGGIYSPKWTSTTYTMLLLRDIGLPTWHPAALKASKILLDRGFYPDGGINYFGVLKHSETCVTGMILSILSYFGCQDERIDALAEHLLGQQMADGGWNCQSYKGATHGSFNTTILVLEGLRKYEKTHPQNTKEIRESQLKAREFLLIHRLYKSDKTGKAVNPSFTRFSFPPRWHYDVMRALDYFQEVKAEHDPRMKDAIELILKKRRDDGTWPLQQRWPGRSFFDMEQPGKSSRWNTLRALRILKWWYNE